MTRREHIRYKGTQYKTAAVSMNPSRIKRRVVHVLLVILQFTLLQWHMQLAQATPAGQGALMADCLMESQADTATPAGNPPAHMDDCCSGQMALDCQYHCSAGVFLFVSVLPAVTRLLPVAHDLPELRTSPETLVVRAHFRPPRDILA